MASSDICRLCGETQPLCRSHIIPEFCFKGMYDDKGRAVAFPPTEPDAARFVQKGYREPLLCSKCECLINDRYEKPFHRDWILGNALGPLNSSRAATIRGLDYASFKLFHLSVLFRASSSAHANYMEVDLGKHHETIRRLILSGDPGGSHDYRILCSAIDLPRGGGVWKDFVGPAHRIRLYGCWGYIFTFAGAQWHYFTSNHPVPEIDHICLNEAGVMPVARLPWKPFELYRDEMRDSSR